MNDNEHIRSFLDYYHELSLSPEYAVLLKGKWGSGKTWFIRDYLKSRDLDDKGKRVLFVSLYGLSSFAEIEQKFFEQLHPVLSSKGAILAGKIAKGFLKTAIKIDLNENTEASVSGGDITELNLPSYLTDTSGCLLVFDDLERCSMPIAATMGYINHLVEVQGYKAIILANEVEIEKGKKAKKAKDARFKNYGKIKEKLIGRTFEVAADVEGALSHFLDLLEDGISKKALEEAKNTILEIYDTSTHNNLRALRQSLFDLQRLLGKIPHKCFDKPQLIKDIIKVFLVFSLEIRSGSIHATDIGSDLFDRLPYNLGGSPTKQKKTTYGKTIEKYKIIDPHNILWDADLWIEIFDKGLISKNRISAEIDKTRYFYEDRLDNWRILWNFWRLRDDTFEDTLESVKEEFFTTTPTNKGILKHIVGMLLSLSESGLTDTDKKDILKRAKVIIDLLQSQGDLINEEDRFREHESWGGLMFHGRDIKEFQEFIEYLTESETNAHADHLSKVSKDLLKTLVESPKEFRALISPASPDCKYQNQPVFENMDAEEFLASLEAISPKEASDVIRTLKDRYTGSYYDELRPELHWLREFSDALRRRSHELKGKISGHRLKGYNEHSIEPAAKFLDENARGTEKGGERKI